MVMRKKSRVFYEVNNLINLPLCSRHFCVDKRSAERRLFCYTILLREYEFATAAKYLGVTGYVISICGMNSEGVLTCELRVDMC
jgi:hypothetical protein